MSDGLLVHETHGAKLSDEGSVNDLTPWAHSILVLETREEVEFPSATWWVVLFARALKKTENCFLRLAERMGGISDAKVRERKLNQAFSAFVKSGDLSTSVYFVVPAVGLAPCVAELGWGTVCSMAAAAQDVAGWDFGSAWLEVPTQCSPIKPSITSAASPCTQAWLPLPQTLFPLSVFRWMPVFLRLFCCPSRDINWVILDWEVFPKAPFISGISTLACAVILSF